MALQRCGLEHLLDRLNERESWDRVLSVGEHQQRLAFARLLLHKPNWCSWMRQRRHSTTITRNR
jgi:putative ATP-binding cassette transporter